MKKIGTLMEELGFNKNAPDSVKEAFIKHLIKASTGTHVITPSEKAEIAKNPEKILSLNPPQQLSFDFYSEVSKPSSRKKAVS